MKPFHTASDAEHPKATPTASDTSDESRTAAVTTKADSGTPKPTAQKPERTGSFAAGESTDTTGCSVPASGAETPSTEESDSPASNTPALPGEPPCELSAAPSDASPDNTEEAPPRSAASSAPTESEDTARELLELREELTRLREELRECVRPERFAKEYEEFRIFYPDVPLSAMPDEVWESVRQGTPLAAAFAFAQRRKHCALRQAEESNRKNRLRSTGAVGRENPTYFTPDEVRAMTQKEVRENYRCILSSMQKWR